MNWVGGARNRVKFQGDRRLQKEFFERKKLDLKCEKLHRPTLCHSNARKKKHISQDLVALRTVSDASVKGGNTMPHVKQVDLERRSLLHAGKFGKTSAGRFNKPADVQCGRVELPFSPELVPSKLDLLEAEAPRNIAVPTCAKLPKVSKPRRESSATSLISLACGSKQFLKHSSPDMSRAPQTHPENSLGRKETYTCSSDQRHFTHHDHSHHKWPSVHPLWVTEDFQASPIIPSDTAKESLGIPDLPFPSQKPESARCFTERFEEYKVSQVLRLSSSTTPSPNLWKTNPRGVTRNANSQCWSASKIHDLRALSPQFRRPWSLSDSETICEKFERTHNYKRPPEILYGNSPLSSRWIHGSSNNLDESTDSENMIRSRESHRVSGSQQPMVRDADRRFGWDSLFLSQPVRSEALLDRFSAHSDRQDHGMIELGACADRPTHATVHPASKCMAWMKKEDQVAEALLELDELEEQSLSDVTAHRSQAVHRSGPGDVKVQTQKPASNRNPTTFQSDTDRVAKDVVENLVHSVVLSLSQNHRSSTAHIPSNIHLQPVAGQGSSLTVQGTAGRRLMSDAAAQTDWTVIGVECRGTQVERKIMVDAGVQWESPPGSRTFSTAVEDTSAKDTGTEGTGAEDTIANDRSADDSSTVPNVQEIVSSVISAPLVATPEP